MYKFKTESQIDRQARVTAAVLTGVVLLGFVAGALALTLCGVTLAPLPVIVGVLAARRAMRQAEGKSQGCGINKAGTFRVR